MPQKMPSDFFDLYRQLNRPAVTAHETYIGRYPGNSLMGIEAAVQAGCDFVEYDVRTSSDGIPVLFHDKDLKRVAGIDRALEDCTFRELTGINISHYEYFLDCSGRTRPEPLLPSCPVSSLEEIWEKFSDRIFMNIQIYEEDPARLRRICEMFRAFDLYQRGYFTMLNFTEARKIRAIDPEIRLCVLNRPLDSSRTTMALLHDFHEFGCRIAQPRWFDITPEYCEVSHELGIYSNVYYANYRRDAEYFTRCGIDGILTDYPDLIIPAVNPQMHP